MRLYEITWDLSPTVRQSGQKHSGLVNSRGAERKTLGRPGGCSLPAGRCLARLWGIRFARAGQEPEKWGIGGEDDGILLPQEILVSFQTAAKSK